MKKTNVVEIIIVRQPEPKREPACVWIEERQPEPEPVTVEGEAVTYTGGLIKVEIKRPTARRTARRSGAGVAS